MGPPLPARPHGGLISYPPDFLSEVSPPTRSFPSLSPTGPSPSPGSRPKRPVEKPLGRREENGDPEKNARRGERAPTQGRLGPPAQDGRRARARLRRVRCARERVCSRTGSSGSGEDREGPQGPSLGGRIAGGRDRFRGLPGLNEVIQGLVPAPPEGAARARLKEEITGHLGSSMG